VNNLKIGISSPAFALKPFLDILEPIASNFKLWEIVADLNQMLPEICDDIKQYSPSYEIEFTVHAPFNDLNIASLNPKLRQIAINYLKETIKISADLGINMVTIHPGHQSPSGVYALNKVLSTNVKSIHEIAQFASDLNIKLALENMPIKHWTLGNTAKEILEMIYDTKLGICFDVGHAYLQSEVEQFLEHIDKIYNVHLHDNFGRRDEHLVLGKGKIDFPNILEKLKNNYSGNLIIESNNLEEGIRSKAYLDDFFN
jgi:sugar phosphate isomerase/epimerase